MKSEIEIWPHHPSEAHSAVQDGNNSVLAAIFEVKKMTEINTKRGEKRVQNME